MTWLRTIRQKLLPYLAVRGANKLYVYAVLIGVMAGLAAALFSVGVSGAEQLLQGELAGGILDEQTGPSSARNWLWLVLPALGGLGSGLITHFFAPEAAGPGTDAMVDAFHNNEGRIRPRVPLVKALATICTLGSGGSAGKEGPLSQVGAGIGSWWADFCGLGSRARRALLLAGAAAGLGAVFRSPLGGALTSIEVLYREDFESDAFVPCVISSVTGYGVVSLFLGGEHIFELAGNVRFSHPNEIFLYAGLGLLCFPAGWLYTRFFQGCRRVVFERLPLPRYLVPAVGGLGAGFVGWFHPEVLGTGTGYLQHVLSDEISLPWTQAVRLFAQLALLKVVTTTFTAGSGASGGVFAPSLFIGGMLGGIVGTIGQHFFPDTITSVAPYVLVGMGAFFAGVANTPLASLIMVSEMTGGYELLAPMLAVGMLALLLNRRWSIYHNQVKNRFESPAHLWDMRPDILQNNKIQDAVTSLSRRAVVQNNMLLFSLEARAQELHATDFVVVDESERYVGMVSLRHTVLREPDPFLRNIVMLEDVTTATPTVAPQDNLRDALATLLNADMDKVAVVENDRVLGYVTNRDILRAYETAVRRGA